MDTMNTPWTKLQDEPIFARAFRVMTGNPRRHYHNYEHVHRLYCHAKSTLCLPYDRALDLSILTHDVIFDAHGDRELRSIEWLEENLPAGSKDPDFQKAASLIEGTIKHKIQPDYRMVMLDLADFLDRKAARNCTELLHLEASALHGMDDLTFYSGCNEYLSDLLVRFKVGASSLPADVQLLHKGICQGISETKGDLQAEICSYSTEHSLT